MHGGLLLCSHCVLTIRIWAHRCQLERVALLQIVRIGQLSSFTYDSHGRLTEVLVSGCRMRCNIVVDVFAHQLDGSQLLGASTTAFVVLF